MTWKEIKNKYPEYRNEMSIEREKELVADLFDAYENEDSFAKTFWCMGGDFADLIGKEFKVIGRCRNLEDDSENGVELECQPMWNIEFENGVRMAAYPEEIIEREQKENGRR